MEVTVDDSVELFEEMLMMAELASNEQVRMRLIGGAAMQLWGGALHESRTMTSDLDWALTKEELPDEAAAGVTLNLLVRALRRLGFERPKNWKPSRSGRFKFQRPGSQIDVELLCGVLLTSGEPREAPLGLTIEAATAPGGCHSRRHGLPAPSRRRTTDRNSKRGHEVTRRPARHRLLLRSELRDDQLEWFAGRQRSLRR
ncbi:hypothetical protein [Planctomycetes bacterium Poly30]|uniref:hypothetical protein n=1 Tax=Saltatorellus ferox TaxID=2528018 RepID=UPI0011A9119A